MNDTELENLISGFMYIIKITPKKIEYLDTTLKAKGLEAKHVLDY